MNKILVVAPSWVGDTMLMQPMLARLRQRFPEVQTDVFAPPWTASLLSQTTTSRLVRFAREVLDWRSKWTATSLRMLTMPSEADSRPAQL